MKIQAQQLNQIQTKTLKVGTEKYFLTHIDNIPTQLLTTLFGINTANQISILTTDQ